jgi:hypothetical protein
MLIFERTSSFYTKYATNVQPLLISKQWSYAGYDSFPVKVFFGIVFITAPVLAYALAKMLKVSRFFSLLHLLGVILLFAPLTWGVGKIVLQNDLNTGLFIIIGCINFLFVLLLLPAKSVLQEILLKIKRKINHLPLARVHLSLTIFGNVLIGFGWTLYLILFDENTPLAGTKIGAILILILIGVILVIGQGNQYIVTISNRKFEHPFVKKFLMIINKHKGTLTDLLFWITIVLFICPSDFSQVTNNVYPNVHVFAYLFGPALYHAFGAGSVPGIDYYSQYSVGVGPLATPLIANTLFDTYYYYVVLAIFFISIFYILTYHLLHGLFQSRLWAFAVTFTTIVISFSTKTWLAAPSTLPFRYPFLPVFVWLLAKTLNIKNKRHNTFLTIGSGICIGLSFIANTETGIYIIATTILTYFLFYRLSIDFWRKSMLSGFSAIFSIVSICFLLYGKAIFSSRFIVGVFEAILSYGTGFGDFPMVWGELQSILYNTAAPIISLATLGWVAARNQRRTQSTSQGQHAYLAIFSLLSIFFSIKYINRSFQQTWFVASINSIIVLTWWMKYFLSYFFSDQRESETNANNTRLGTGYLISNTILVIITLLFFSYTSLKIVNSPVGEEAPVGINAFGYWPSIAKTIFPKQHPIPIDENSIRDKEALPNPEDIEFISSTTNPNERITVFSYNDFVYYHEAKRAPNFGAIPSKWTFFDYYIDKWISIKANPVFVETIPESIAQDIMPVLFSDYISYQAPNNGKLTAYWLLEESKPIVFMPSDMRCIESEPCTQTGNLSGTDDTLIETEHDQRAFHFAPSNSTTPYLNRGPFIDLPPGHYEVAFWIRMEESTFNKPAIELVISSQGQPLQVSEIFTSEFNSSEQYQPFTITLEVPSRMSNVEFLVAPRTDNDIWLQNVTLSRISVEK